MKNTKPVLVIVNQNSGYLMVDLAHAHINQYQVVLITGRLILRDEPLNEKVQLDRIIFYNRNSLLKRLFTWLIGAFQIWFKLKFKYKKADVIFVTNPPFNLILPLFVKNKYAFLIYDLYPDALVEQKLLSGTNIFMKWWKEINGKTFKKANSIYVISDGIKKLAANYIHQDKIEVVPLWTKSIANADVAIKQPSFFLQYGITQSFKILYSGNLGLGQPLEAMIELAARFSLADDIAFIIAGEGEKKDALIDMVKSKQIKHIYFLPWQPAEQLPNMLGAASLGFITLAAGASNISVPSKTYNFLGAGLPIIAICEQQAELCMLVELHGCGYCENNNNLDKLAERILDLKSNPDKLNQFKKSAINASKYYTPANAEKIKLK